jgi:hypothetical protein
LTRALGATILLKVERWIPPEAEADALRALAYERRVIELQVFRRALPPAGLAFTEDASVLGRWVRAHRVIEMNRAFVCSAPWLETLEVLKHEMAHQLVDEVFRPRDEPPHGPTFQKVCETFGIDARASGAPVAPTESSAAMRKVEKLLSLGQSAERHEAEAAMKRAQAILRSHNLERLEAARPASYTFRQLGGSKARVEGVHRWVATILSSHFFVETIWVPAFVPGRAKMGMALEISGTPENIEVAAYVHDFLLGTADRLWRAHKAETGASGHGRRRFLTGVMIGFLEKLHASTAEARPEERALLHAGDPALRAYHHRRYPRQSSWRSGGIRNDETFDAGKAAGRDIVLRKGVESRGEGGGLRLGDGT